MASNTREMLREDKGPRSDQEFGDCELPDDF